MDVIEILERPEFHDNVIALADRRYYEEIFYHNESSFIRLYRHNVFHNVVVFTNAYLEVHTKTSKLPRAMRNEIKTIGDEALRIVAAKLKKQNEKDN